MFPKNLISFTHFEIFSSKHLVSLNTLYQMLTRRESIYLCWKRTKITNVLDFLQHCFFALFEKSKILQNTILNCWNLCLWISMLPWPLNVHKFSDTNTLTQSLFIKGWLRIPALPSLQKVTPAVYPHLNDFTGN